MSEFPSKFAVVLTPLVSSWKLDVPLVSEHASTDKDAEENVKSVPLVISAKFILRLLKLSNESKKL